MITLLLVDFKTLDEPGFWLGVAAAEVMVEIFVCYLVIGADMSADGVHVVFLEAK